MQSLHPKVAKKKKKFVLTFYTRVSMNCNTFSLMLTKKRKALRKCCDCIQNCCRITFQASSLFLLMFLALLQKGLFTLPGISKRIPLELSIIFHCLDAISNYHIFFYLATRQAPTSVLGLLFLKLYAVRICKNSLECSCLLQEG